jgi:WD40 repeat protein
VAWSPDGKTLATTTGNVLRRNWEDTSESGDIALRDPESLEVRKAEGWFSNAGDTVGGLVRWGVAYSPDGRTLAVADDGCSVNWVGAEDFRTPCILAARHTGEVTSVAIRPDGTMLAGGSKDGSVSRVRLSGLEASEPFFLRGHQGPVNSVAFSADGALLASASSDRTVRLWEAETGRLSRTLRRHDALLTAVAFGRDGRFMASGGSDGSVFLWDAKSFQPLASFHDHTDAVRAVAFCPNGRLLGSASFDGTVRLRPVDPEDLSMYLSFGRFEGLDFRIDLVNPSLDTRENPLDVLRSLGGK